MARTSAQLCRQIFTVLDMGVLCLSRNPSLEVQKEIEHSLSGAIDIPLLGAQGLAS